MPEQLATYQKARLQVVAHRNIQAAVTEALTPFGINTSQWIILGWLRDNSDGMRVTGLAEVLQVETPLVTSLVQPLEAKGNVKVSVDTLDKRARVLTLTQAGTELVVAIEAAVAQPLKLLEKGVRKSSLASYFTLLQKIIDNGNAGGKTGK
ncbi:MarR family transcriptional regulator [Candidatus Saccharibacteria bacterium]|nr:MarR family transcriptional regulator [Candidatus Saccharibacteria bacterium]